MTISKSNKRVIITIPTELHEQIEQIAENENRSVSNYIVTIVKKEIEKSRVI